MKMDTGAMAAEALKLMGAGVGMVFAVLAIFYGLVRALMFLFPGKRENDAEPPP
jgi:Na+-transporting methylmalonyl-CoA/oxaloacetate decarboxylase gamma subunit